MKTLHSNLTIWLLAATLSGTSLAACAQATTGTTAAAAPADPAKSTLLQPMQQMVTKLKKLQATGDPDFDYALQAKVHTQGGLDLMKQEVQAGKDTSLKKMAQTLMAAAQNDVTMLDGTMKQIKPTRPNQAFTQQQSRNIEAINLKLQQTGSSDKLTGDIDKNFAALLLDQRQDAIDMANTYLQYGKNSTLRTYAEQMIAKAKQEMDQIKALPK
ncbi:DUF305 domain-containing protein [Spirosoma soli]|uniref:DUF305 domain-containing protein n=1 Tax=Spirosoma soli TaxID=1770529 RepID=A0ABW5M270_9BACT